MSGPSTPSTTTAANTASKQKMGWLSSSREAARIVCDFRILHTFPSSMVDSLSTHCSCIDRGYYSSGTTLPSNGSFGPGLCALELLLDRLRRFSQLARCSPAHTPSSPPYREVWSIAQPSARMCLLALPLVQPHPTPGLHQRHLHRRVRGL